MARGCWSVEAADMYLGVWYVRGVRLSSGVAASLDSGLNAAVLGCGTGL